MRNDCLNIFFDGVSRSIREGESFKIRNKNYDLTLIVRVIRVFTKPPRTVKYTVRKVDRFGSETDFDRSIGPFQGSDSGSTFHACIFLEASEEQRSNPDPHIHWYRWEFLSNSRKTLVHSCDD